MATTLPDDARVVAFKRRRKGSRASPASPPTRPAHAPPSAPWGELLVVHGDTTARRTPELDPEPKPEPTAVMPLVPEDGATGASPQHGGEARKPRVFVLPSLDWRPAAAGPLDRSSSGPPAGTGGTARAPPPSRPRRLVQSYMDLGQRDFARSLCQECGFTYAKGVIEDDRLHRAHHENVVRGPRCPRGLLREATTTGRGTVAATAASGEASRAGAGTQPLPAGLTLVVPPPASVFFSSLASLAERRTGICVGSDCEAVVAIEAGRRAAGCVFWRPGEGGAVSLVAAWTAEPHRRRRIAWALLDIACARAGGRERADAEAAPVSKTADGDAFLEAYRNSKPPRGVARPCTIDRVYAWSAVGGGG